MSQLSAGGTLETSWNMIDPGILKWKMKSSEVMKVAYLSLGSHIIFSFQLGGLVKSLAFANHFPLAIKGKVFREWPEHCHEGEK